ncbi:unnamed protein product [Cylindrotheca closterium]|uniref:Uncharacterized protein n=1 Tax=Cylindrotheca closterium TaxID=2856 RepID=A0AAD2CJT6_9STRA|nr:unnamed protein product [Cylindrotheca closterium]
MTRTFDSTPAENVVREVADILGAEEKLINQMCENMEKELILQEWQLSALEASEWRLLGAPIGVAAAIRKLASEDAQRGSNFESFRKNEAPASMFSTRSTFAKSLTQAVRAGNEAESPASEHLTSIRGANEQSTRDHQTIEEAAEIEESDRGVFGKSTPTLFQMLYSSGCDVFRALYSKPFPMSSTFDRALLHSKSGADLKAHTVFKLEIGVVAAALLLGASIEMWGLFPADAVDWQATAPADGGEPVVPYVIALIYNSISGLVIFTELLSVFMNVGQLMVTTAVAETKFPQFFQQLSATSGYTNGLFQLGLNGFIINIVILMVAQTAAVTSNRTIMLICGWIVPAVIIIPCGLAFHVILSFVGRSAFNGYLLVKDEVPKNGPDLDKSIDAIKIEQVLCRNYFENVSTNDEEVLNRSEQLKQQHFLRKRTMNEESRTIRNSRMIVPLAKKHNVGADYFPKFQEPQNQ